MSTGTARSSNEQARPRRVTTASPPRNAILQLYSTCDLSWRKGKIRLTSYIVVLFAPCSVYYLSNLEFS